MRGPFNEPIKHHIIHLCEVGKYDQDVKMLRPAHDRMIEAAEEGTLLCLRPFMPRLWLFFPSTVSDNCACGCGVDPNQERLPSPQTPRLVLAPWSRPCKFHAIIVDWLLMN